MVCSKSWQDSSRDSTLASSSRTWVSFDSGVCGQYDASTFPNRCYTDFLVQRSLRLDVIFLEFVVELFEGFEVLDRDAHLLDFLS